MQTVQDDIKTSYKLILTEAANTAHSRQLRRLLATSGTMHALLMVPARNDDEMTTSRLTNISVDV